MMVEKIVEAYGTGENIKTFLNLVRIATTAGVTVDVDVDDECDVPSFDHHKFQRLVNKSTENLKELVKTETKPGRRSIISTPKIIEIAMANELLYSDLYLLLSEHPKKWNRQFVTNTCKKNENLKQVRKGNGFGMETLFTAVRE